MDVETTRKCFFVQLNIMYPESGRQPEAEGWID